MSLLVTLISRVPVLTAINEVPSTFVPSVFFCFTSVWITLVSEILFIDKLKQHDSSIYEIVVTKVEFIIKLLDLILEF